MKNKASDVPERNTSEALLYLMKVGLQRIRLKNRISLQPLLNEEGVVRYNVG